MIRLGQAVGAREGSECHHRSAGTRTPSSRRRAPPPHKCSRYTTRRRRNPRPRTRRSHRCCRQPTRTCLPQEHTQASDRGKLGRGSGGGAAMRTLVAPALARAVGHDGEGWCGIVLVDRVLGASRHSNEQRDEEPPHVNLFVGGPGSVLQRRTSAAFPTYKPTTNRNDSPCARPRHVTPTAQAVAKFPCCRRRHFARIRVQCRVNGAKFFEATPRAGTTARPVSE